MECVTLVFIAYGSACHTQIQDLLQFCVLATAFAAFCERKDASARAEILQTDGAGVGVTLPPLSGPDPVSVWTTKGEFDVRETAQARGDQGEAA